MNPPPNFIIESTVTHGKEQFLVSTFEQETGALGEIGPHSYNKTVVWEYDEVGPCVGPTIFQTGDVIGSLREHFRVCEAYHKTGDGPSE